MRCDPRCRRLIRECFSVCVAAVGQYRHKQVHLDRFARVRIRQFSRLPGPVHLHVFAWLALDVHCSLGTLYKLPIILLELSQLVRQLACVSATVTVLNPQQL